MNKVTDNFAWTQQLQCPPTVCNESVKKILCKDVLEFLWNDISCCAFPTAETLKIRKNILLYKLRHGLNDSAIATVKGLSQLRANSNTLQHQISVAEKEYEEQDYVVRQKMQQLKDIKTTHSTIVTRKDIMKLKYSETKKQLKLCSDMRQVCRHLMPNTSKNIDQQKLRENLDAIVGLRSAADKKQIRRKISTSLGDIDTYTLWAQLYQTLSQDLDTLMKLEIKDDFSSSNAIGENINIGISRACGQHICMISKRVFSNVKTNKYQQRLMEFIELIEPHEHINAWLVLILEVKKLETEQTCLQDQVQKLKNNIQENSLLNFNVAELTADIEAIDAQMDEYVKNIQQSIAVLNSAAPLVFRIKEKLHYELERIVALQAGDYDPKCLNNALDKELDVFYNVLEIDALQKVMLKGNVGQYRHAICGFNKASIATINPQCSRIQLYFPMVHVPIYSLVECYKNAMANIIYTKLHCPVLMKDECMIKSVPTQEKYNHIILELLSISKITYDQAREEIEQFNMILNSWINQDVQEAMTLYKATVDDISFKDWLQRYSLLLYMIQNAK